MTQFLRYFLLVLVVLGLTACETNEERFKHMNEQQLFTGGQEALQKKDYAEAIDYFEAQEAQFPYGDYATQEQMEVIYAYYQNDAYPSAQSAAERFIHLHPDNEHVDYAYYMRGLSAFASDRTFLENYFPVDPALRDLQPNIQAFNYFNQLIQQYPDSLYNADARMHMLYIRNMIARNNVAAARYYYSRGAYVAALNRVQAVVMHFQQTPSVPAALVLMVQCYRHLGLTENANLTLAILQLNYPEAVASVDDENE